MNVSMAIPDYGVENDRPAPPPLYERLFEAFERADLAWCSWKSPSRLPDAYAGRSDLDLLIARTDRQQALQILVDCGFKPAPDGPGRDDPAMSSFLGFDPVSGALLHAHVHFRLILGPSLFKNARLPSETAFLERSRLLPGRNPRVLAPEDAALLLFVRRQLEFSRFDPVQIARREQIDQKFRKDFAELAPLIDSVALRNAAEEIFDADLAARVVRAIIADPMGASAGLRREVARALSLPRRCGGVEAALVGAARTAAFLFGAFNRRHLQTPRIWGRRAPGGGLVIAFVGVDGSGKSTAATTIRNWLGPEIDVVRVYFGTGDGAPSLVLAPFKALAGLIARFIKTKPKGASHGNISDRPPGPFYSALFAVWAMAVALDKRHKLVTIQRAARRGFIVVTDRYPQNEIENFNDGPLLYRLASAPDWLRRFEQAIYMRAHRAPPDLIVKLQVGPETVQRREPDMNPALIVERLASLERLQFPGAKIIRIDARAPLEDVTAKVKQAVWNVL
jgi:thymidylate kinase